MPPRPAPASPALDLAPPGWIHAFGVREHESDALGAASVAVATLDAVVARALPGRGAWAERLALRAAAAGAAAAGRREDTAAIRDLLTIGGPPDSDIGPAGRLGRHWRAGGRRSPALDDDLVASVLRQLALPAPAGLDAVLHQARALAGSSRLPPIAAVELAAAAAALPAEAEPIGLWLMDSVLAARARWPIVVPLLAGEVQSHRGGLGRLVRSDPEGWRRQLFAGYAAGASAAAAAGQDLAARAQRLQAARPQLRTKRAEPMFDALQDRDAVWPGAPMGEMTDRSRRRLVERLQQLGLVRALTDRPTHRLYGL